MGIRGARWTANRVLILAEARETLEREGVLELDTLARIVGARGKRKHFKKVAYRLRDDFGVEVRLQGGAVVGLDEDPRVEEVLTEKLAAAREVVASGPNEAVFVRPEAVAAEIGLDWAALGLEVRHAVEAIATLRTADGYMHEGLHRRAVVAADRVEALEVRRRLLEAIGREAAAEVAHDERQDAPEDELADVRRLVGAQGYGVGGAIIDDPEALSPREARKQLQEALAIARATRRTTSMETTTTEAETKARKEETKVEPKTTECDECGKVVETRGLHSHKRSHVKRAAAPKERAVQAAADPLNALREALACMPQGARRPALELLLALEAS